MSGRKRAIAGVMILLLSLVACQSGRGPIIAPTTTPSPADPAVAALEAAQSTLEAHLGRELEGIEVAYGPAEWPDSSLGCPREGETYTEGLVPGYQFEFTVEGVAYELHTDAGSGVVVLCSEDEDEAEVAEPHTMALAAVRAQLAAELGVGLADLPEPTTTEPAEWPDTALGCPQQGVEYTQGMVSGYRFQFLYNVVTYDLRASQDGELVVLCPPEDHQEPPPLAATATAVPEAMQKPLDAARSLLAEKLGVAAESLELEALTWESASFPTSALGCPQPGTNYLTVITEGYRFWLTYAGRGYEIHTDRSGRAAVWCTGKDAQKDSPSAGTPGGFVFTSYSNEALDLGISYPLSWAIEPGPAQAELYFGPAGGDPTHGMRVLYLGDAPGDLGDWLSDYQITLYAADPTAIKVGERENAGNGGRSQRFSREIKGVKVMERATFFSEGYRVLQWAPAQEWTNWDDPFLQMLNSLIFTLEKSIGKTNN